MSTSACPHVTQSPNAWVTSMSSSSPVRVCLGDDPDDWSSWFTCCEIHALSQHRTDPSDAVPAAWVLRLWPLFRFRVAWRVARFLARHT